MCNMVIGITHTFSRWQELDDVYHDVSAVMAECMVQGADMISMKVAL